MLDILLDGSTYRSFSSRIFRSSSSLALLFRYSILSSSAMRAIISSSFFLLSSSSSCLRASCSRKVIRSVAHQFKSDNTYKTMQYLSKLLIFNKGKSMNISCTLSNSVFFQLSLSHLLQFTGILIPRSSLFFRIHGSFTLSCSLCIFSVKSVPISCFSSESLKITIITRAMKAALKQVI